MMVAELHSRVALHGGNPLQAAYPINVSLDLFPDNIEMANFLELPQSPNLPQNTSLFGVKLSFIASRLHWLTLYLEDS